MALISIRHETRYDYPSPVSFGPHRLLIRPLGTHATRVISAELTVSPPGEIRWTYDALGNCVCWFTPMGESRQLLIASELIIERFPAPLAPAPAQDPRTVLPIVYDARERVTLAPFMAPVSADPDLSLVDWVRARLGAPDEPALDFLLRLNSLISAEIEYCARDEAGVLEPDETLRRGAGTCRDLAWLMVEALRRLGYAARFVTGYLYAPGITTIRGAGATHAWVQVFLPDLGWLEFDPTNGLAESADLIPVAVTRTPDEAAPVSGVVMSSDAVSDMTVSVEVRPAEPAAIGTQNDVLIRKVF